MHTHQDVLCNYQTCTRCIYDERVPSITFDVEGICNYCHQIEGLVEEYGTGSPKGESKLQSIVDIIKVEGRGKKYDCVIGVSGGTDSSYMVYLAKQMAQQGGMPTGVAVYTPGWLPVFALVFATLIGLISGLYPALRAATLVPVEALPR
jgi:hypothetical protein